MLRRPARLDNSCNPARSFEVSISYTYLTNVLEPHHSIILRDWLEFMTVLPLELVVYIRDDQKIKEEVAKVAASFGVPFTPIFPEEGDDLRNNETAILKRMVGRTKGEFLFFAHLDTLPFRSGPGEDRWFEDVFSYMGQDGCVFFSACGLRFRADQELVAGRYLRTQRFSNNCALIAKKFWEDALVCNPADGLVSTGAYRYHSEWAVEEKLRKRNLFGIRRYDSLDWRVFHVQQWDDRLLMTRDLFRRGEGVKAFFNRVHEDYRHPWEIYFNYPRPGRFKRLRIRLGELRRNMMAKVRR